MEKANQQRSEWLTAKERQNKEKHLAKLKAAAEKSAVNGSPSLTTVTVSNISPQRSLQNIFRHVSKCSVQMDTIFGSVNSALSL